MKGECDGKTWRASLALDKVQKDANDFMSSLAVHLHDSNTFCEAVSEATGGVVEYASTSGGSSSVTTPRADDVDLET